MRVKFDLDVEDGYPPISSELIHGEEMSNLHVKIANTPFFVEGVALGDIVLCKPYSDGLLEFVSLVEESGNRAISIIFIDLAAAETVYQEIKSMGHYCEYGEFPQYAMLAVSVDKGASLSPLVSYLSELEHGGKISYAELCV